MNDLLREKLEIEWKYGYREDPEFYDECEEDVMPIGWPYERDERWDESWF